MKSDFLKHPVEKNESCSNFSKQSIESFGILVINMTKYPFVTSFIIQNYFDSITDSSSHICIVFPFDIFLQLNQTFQLRYHFNFTYNSFSRICLSLFGWIFDVNPIYSFNSLSQEFFSELIFVFFLIFSIFFLFFSFFIICS